MLKVDNVCSFAKVKALIVNHGSWITEDDVKSLKQPSLWNGSENDKQIPKDLFYTFEKIVKGNNIPTDFKASEILHPPPSAGNLFRFLPKMSCKTRELLHTIFIIPSVAALDVAILDLQKFQLWSCGGL